MKQNLGINTLRKNVKPNNLIKDANKDILKHADMAQNDVCQFKHIVVEKERVPKENIKLNKERELLKLKINEQQDKLEY